MTLLSAARFSVLALAVAGLAAVAPPARAQNGNADPECASFPCGRVETIRQTSVKQSWTPLGTGASFDSDPRTAAAIQIGPGLSNQGMVVLGAGGGAAYRKAPSSYDKPRWEVTVRLDNGQKRVVTVAYEPFVREGDRVRIAGNSLERVD
jgi:outer membrane lipoprotein SlyB